MNIFSIQDQKKLQNLFPTGKEAVNGAKSTPRGNSFNRKKTDESGFMTPIPRRLSVSSATSELLVQCSYSGCYDTSWRSQSDYPLYHMNFASISEDAMPSFTSITSSEPGSPSLN